MSALSARAEDGGRDIFNTNVFGVLGVTRAFAPIIEANGGGTIVNILSVASWRSSPVLAVSCASKAAAWSLTSSLRLELAPRAIHVIGVHCGFVDTEPDRRNPGRQALAWRCRASHTRRHRRRRRRGAGRRGLPRSPCPPR